MYYPVETCFKRLRHTLEHVIAPEVDDEFALGQVYAVISLLNQLGGEVEMKREILLKDTQTGAPMLSRIIEVLKDRGVDVPADLAEASAAVDAGKDDPTPALGKKMDEALSNAIDIFYASREKMGQDAWSALDLEVRDYLLKTATRHVGLMKPPLLEKISRPKG